jgi:hypothetical protein
MKGYKRIYDFNLNVSILDLRITFNRQRTLTPRRFCSSKLKSNSKINRIKISNNLTIRQILKKEKRKEITPT